jgi:hypothetical protein
MTMKDILALVGFDRDYWNFSRKAGCSCGCSKGFIRDSYYDNHFDYFITVELEG